MSKDRRPPIDAWFDGRKLDIVTLAYNMTDKEARFDILIRGEILPVSTKWHDFTLCLSRSVSPPLFFKGFVMCPKFTASDLGDGLFDIVLWTYSKRIATNLGPRFIYWLG